MDDLDEAQQPRCEVCGTVMREADGGYECGYCGHTLDVPWVERPRGADELPGFPSY